MQGTTGIVVTEINIIKSVPLGKVCSYLHMLGDTFLIERLVLFD